jgi:hypothetical protein
MPAWDAGSVGGGEPPRDAGRIAESGPSPNVATPTGPDEERARRAALQMAAAGKSRGEVAHHLQELFDLERIEPVLAHIFGPEREC